MNTYFWVGILVGVLLLLMAIPYVQRIRHPEQKPLAAYMIFATLFGASAVVLFNLVLWLGEKFAPGWFGENAFALLVLMILVFIPAILLGTWQAAKPPWRQAPPE